MPLLHTVFFPLAGLDESKSIFAPDVKQLNIPPRRWER